MKKLFSFIITLFLVFAVTAPVMAQDANSNAAAGANAAIQNSFNTPAETEAEVDSGDSNRQFPNGHDMNFVHRDSFYGKGPDASPLVQSVDSILSGRPSVYTRYLLCNLKGEAEMNHIISSYFGEFRLTSEKYVMFLTPDKMNEIRSSGKYVIKIASDTVDIKAEDVTTEQALYSMAFKLMEYGANAFAVVGEYASMKHKSDGEAKGIGMTAAGIGGQDGRGGANFTFGWSESEGMAQKLKYPGLRIVGYYVKDIEDHISAETLKKVKNYQAFAKKVQEMRDNAGVKIKLSGGNSMCGDCKLTRNK